MTRRVQAAPGPALDPLPRLPEVERALAGALVMGADAEAVGAVRLALAPGDVTDPIAAAVIAAVCAAVEDGRPADYVAITAELAATGHARPSDVTALLVDAGVPQYAPHYAAQLADVAARRRMIALAADMAAEAYRGTGEPAELAGRFAAALAPLASGRAGLDDDAGCLGPALAAIEAGADPRAGAWPTGIRPIDAAHRGIRRGDMVVLAGHLNVGKSWLVVSIANAAIRAGQSVLVASLEMSVLQLAGRLRANRIATSPLPLPEAQREARSVLGDVQAIRVIETARTASAIAANVAAFRPDVVIVDHVGLLSPADPRLSGYEATRQDANAMQRLSREADVAVVVLAQLSRDANRAQAQGAAAGLDAGVKGAATWEENADMTVLLRGIYEPAAPAGSAPDHYAIAIAKARYGPRGAVVLYDRDDATGRLIERDPTRVIRPAGRSWAEMAAGGDA